MISPLNSLYLLVENSKKSPNPKDIDLASTDGYISIPISEVKQLEFTVMVLKTEDYKDKFAHFTLIVSTKETNIKL